ncbi:voltage-gated potassium channel [Agromyces flavus]|uniref:Voltage-gated potassium channel n=1 Tax=Agromyces flavus TaxID=589382 RepID=A0A1H1U689_9MICO|nr:potassium channel family protein [Agromyces flavus]MCP2368286.1 voltage-gated potassium channel [Agromyces flavus]SDS67766.1 voltage-gated potassium channel [Agromyces flavus]
MSARGAASDESRRMRWTEATQKPLAVAGVAFVVGYVVFVLWQHPPDAVLGILVILLIAGWLAFVLDVVVQILLTPSGRRWNWVWRHPVEVLSAVLPLFRALRVVSLVRHLPALERRTTSAVRARFVSEALTYAFVFVFFIALVTYHVERDAPGANIVTFGDALWWACVTLATVGYGDTYPVTTLGRLYAVLLMAGGVAILGTASAALVSVLNERLAKLRRGTGADTPLAERTGLMDDATGAPAAGLREDLPAVEDAPRSGGHGSGTVRPPGD